MAVKTTEQRCMLKTVVSNADSEGNVKKRSVTLRNVDPVATDDNLYKLSTHVKGLVEGNLAETVKITEAVLAEEV